MSTLRWRDWGTCVVMLLCMIGLTGCAAGTAGGGEGEGEGETEAGELTVNFDEAQGGNFAVAQDDAGNEYTFRARGDAGSRTITEANVRMTDGTTVKASLDSEGQPVKLRAGDGSNADLVFESGNTSIRYTDADGNVTDASGLDSSAAKERVQARRIATQDKRRIVMRDNGRGVTDLLEGLRLFEEIVESILDEEANPDSPLHGTSLAEAIRLIGRIASLMDIEEVEGDDLADVDLDEVPEQIRAIAGNNYLLFEAEGLCLGEHPGRVDSHLSFDLDGILINEFDKNLLFDVSEGGADTDRGFDINWDAGTPIAVVREDQGLGYTVDVRPVFTGTGLGDDGTIIVERRFAAEIESQVELFTVSTARSEQLFNAAFINGGLSEDGILEFDLVLIDLANDTPVAQLGRLRYYNQNAGPPPEDSRHFQCDIVDDPGAEAHLNCDELRRVAVYEPFEMALITRADNPNLDFDWFVSAGYGYVEDPFAPYATMVVGLAEGPLEISLIVSDLDTEPAVFSYYSCEVFVGERDQEHGVPLDCPQETIMGVPERFRLDHMGEAFQEVPDDVGTDGDDFGTSGDDVGTDGDDFGTDGDDFGTDGDDVDTDGHDHDDAAELEFCEYNLDLNVGDVFNIRDYVRVKDGHHDVDWNNVYFTYTEAGANDPTNPPDWNLAAFNAGQDVEVALADALPGTGNRGPGEYRIYIVRVGHDEFDDHLTFRVDNDRESEVNEAKCDGDDGGDEDHETFYEWYVLGTSEFWVDRPFAPDTEIVFFEPGWFEVNLAVYYPDGSAEFGACEVYVDPGDFDECEEFGWYGDGVCDDFCLRPDPDCGDDDDWCAEHDFYGDGFCDWDCPRPDPDCDEDWCEHLGKYGDGHCDPDCPHPDPDCQDIDWCEEEGFYGDGFCDWDCPRPDPDCEGIDWCEERGFYGDGFCDWDCPHPDPDCQDVDWCEERGFYGDGWCDWECPRPDPDCEDDFDWCEEEGFYGDGHCDYDCPHHDPDCQDIDWCEEEGFYGDGYCDWECPRPDPDCEGTDWCEEQGYYGDGHCDPDCPHPDPDCQDIDWCEEGGFYGDGHCDPDCPQPDPDCAGIDWCEEGGYYGDGYCDPDCPQPDPDCEGIDWCEEAGFYGDGHCDPDCPQPDPDCDEGFDRCAELGYYGDGVCHLDCPEPDPDCNEPG